MTMTTGPINREDAIAILESQLADLTLVQSSIKKPNDTSSFDDAAASIALYKHELSVCLSGLQDAKRKDSERVMTSLNGTALENNNNDATKAPRYLNEDKPARICVFCEDEVDTGDSIHGSCYHIWCHKCLNDLFSKATVDESLYPPRCCSEPISMDEVARGLTASVAAAYKLKAPEWEVRDRTYCHIATCSKWISPDKIENEEGVCPECQARTCSICKAEAHVEENCPQDEETNLVLAIAIDKGWQRCPECHRMVGISAGCNHMT